MTIRELLKKGSDRLREKEESPYLDASLLLGHLLSLTKEKLFASFPDPVSSADADRFMELIEKRMDNFPVAYLTGEKEFFGLPYYVDKGILCPRPDTELLVETVLELTENKGAKKIHDLCTGSGCIALSLKNTNPELIVSASDISPISQAVFARNNERLTAGKVEFIKSSLFDDIKGIFDIIVTNPPYLTSDETDQRMEEGWKEPSLALDGGDDGLDLIRIIIKEAPDHLKDRGRLLIEAHPPQMDEMANLMKEAGFTEIEVLKDLPGLDRVISGIKGNTID